MTEITQSPPQAEAQEEKPRGIRWTIVLLWSAIILLLAVLGWGLVEVNATRPEAGQVAPNFDVEFFNGYEWDGKPVAELEDMRGQVVVLNFWASWCVECRIEADLIEQSWRKYADQGVIFLGVAYADVEPKSIDYLEEFNITYPNAPDLGTDIADDYEITGVPETFFIGRDGEIAHVQIGPVNQATLDSVVGQLLAEGG